MLRHGKSDWDAAFDSDHERPLARRGESAAKAIGRVLARMGQVPDKVITSSAVRARATADLAAGAGGWGCPIQVTDDLYGASPASTLDAVARHGDNEGRLMLVGHDPAWSQLTRALTGAQAQMKTGAVAAIDLGIDDWQHISETRGELAFLLQPRLFTNGEWDL